MANIANLIVKKSDNVTNVTFNAVAGAASDGMAATWVNSLSSTIRANRSSLSMKAKLNGTKTARRVDVQAVFPIIRVINSVETLIGRIPVDFSLPVPEWATDAEIAEAVDQSINLLTDTTVRAQIKSGTSFT